MAKKKKENDIVTDGSRAITKFHVSDVVMVVILVILCATCVVPFIHLLAKSVQCSSYIGVYINGYDRLYMCSLSAVKKEIKGKNILYLYPDVSYVF